MMQNLPIMLGKLAGNMGEPSDYNSNSEYDPYTPSTLGQQVYAAGEYARPHQYAADGRTGPLHKTPKTRTPWTPEGIRAARDAQANRGNTAPSGRRAGPTPAVPPRTAPGPAAPPRKYHCRSHKVIDIMSQLDITPMKITYGAVLKEAPDACADLIQHLGNFSQTSDRTAATRGTQAPRTVHQPAPPAPALPRPFVPPGAVTDSGPTPMETNFETEECYHSESKPQYVNAVVKAEVEILGKSFDCKVDTGASNTVLGHSVVRKLGLMDRLMPSQLSFLTAAGRSERPMGVLPDLPVTLGSLCLHLNCMVTKASNYSVLVGNDWLRMAGADLLLSSKVLRVRLGPEQYEDIRIDTDADQPNISMCKPAKGRHLHHAVQCLGQATALHEHTDNQIKESIPDTAAMTMICTT
ncbi:TPA: hypothetical protein ACH3X2_003775 [Trebouxia sp. C0005]